jgi:formylmethanofuran dehydrogenase subunit B
MTTDGERIQIAERACELAEPFFHRQGEKYPPSAEIEGQPCSLDDAIGKAAEILRKAQSPLVYGMGRSSTEGQRAAIALTERIRGTIDTSASLCHATSMMAIQEVGESTCTLGEVKNRADLVIYWGANPVASHPRHMERYSLAPKGRFVPEGRKGRTLVVADILRTATADLADVFLPIRPGDDFEALHVLRSLVRGIPITPGTVTGAPLSALVELAERMKKCRYGIIFFGLGLSMKGKGDRNVQALLMLVRDLNAHTRFFARRMRIQGDVTGADTILLWQTGYPFAVNFWRGYPRYNSNEFQGNDMLERGEVDACLFVGSEGARRFSPAALEHLRGVPTVALENPSADWAIEPTVRFTTAVYGVHQRGTAFRMDGVPIPLQAVLPTTYLSDAEILKRIAEQV